MKRFFTLAFIATSITTSFSQVLDYNDLGVLFSKDYQTGTARFNALSGAFGALGSDISSFDINPAGAAVATKSKFAVTMANKNTALNLDYYGSLSENQDEFLSIAQAGGVFVFDIDQRNSDWNRVAFSFNYNVKANFDQFFAGDGNSNFLFYDEHINDPNDPPTIFDGALGQQFSSEFRGSNTKFSIGFSAVHDHKLYVGAAIKFHNVSFTERVLLSESNDDIDGNILDVDDYNERFINGDGFSFNAGFIYRVNQFIRLGASYESPTWYQNVIEEQSNVLTMYDIPNLGIDGSQVRSFDGPYSLRFTTPSRFTASGALIFGKQGLISLDYTYKDYQNFSYREVDLILQDANQVFTTDFRPSQKLSAGTEWRFDRLSLRGGYSYEKDPNLVLGGNTNKDNIRSFSAGLGYNFGNTQIDLSYQQAENRQFYTLYNLGDIGVDAVVERIAATITFSL